MQDVEFSLIVCDNAKRPVVAARAFLGQWLRFCMALTFSFFVSVVCFADETYDIGGFTIDNTMTRIGHDFARIVAEYRHLQYGDNANYNLIIHERPSARWGNLIWITENRRTVYRRFLQPRTSELQIIAESAARQVHELIKQEKLQSLFVDTFDLDTDEF